MNLSSGGRVAIGLKVAFTETTCGRSLGARFRPNEVQSVSCMVAD